MSGDHQTRRTCLYRRGTRSSIDTRPYSCERIRRPPRDVSSSPLYDIDPATLVLSGDDVPPAFTPYQTNLGDPPLLVHLRDADPRFEDAATALTGYWAGTDKANPRWVLATLACVCDHKLTLTDADIAARDCHDDLATTYEAELPDSVTVEQSEQLGLQSWQWRIDLIWESTTGEDQSESCPVASDLLQLQWQMNVLFGVVVYGPCGESPEPETRLERFAEKQLTRFTNLRDP